jgi:lycopene beta-cyclase
MSACVDIQQGGVCWVPEETSLVARPGVPMDVIQKRMELRLKHLGIRVRSIEEDE